MSRATSRRRSGWVPIRISTGTCGGRFWSAITFCMRTSRWYASSSVICSMWRRRDLLAGDLLLVLLHHVLHANVLEAEHRLFLRQGTPHALLAILVQCDLRVLVEL